MKRPLSTSRVLTYLWSVVLLALTFIGSDMALAQDTPPAEAPAAEATAAPAEAAPAAEAAAAEAAPAEAAAAPAPTFNNGDIAWLMVATSMPRAATSVATKTRTCPLRRLASVRLRWDWFMLPCSAAVA